MRDHSLWQSVLFGLAVFGCVWALCKAFWCKCYRKIWHNWFDCSLPFFPTFIDSSNATKTHCRRWSENKKNWNLDNLRRPPTSRIAREKRNEIGKNACKRRSIFIVLVGWELGRVRVSVGRAPKGNSSSRCFRCYVSFNLFSTAWVPSVFFSQLLDLVGCHLCWRQVILIFLICQAWMWR